MKRKFKVTVPSLVWVTQEIEIDEDLINECKDDNDIMSEICSECDLSDFSLIQFAGNGSGGDRLCGIYTGKLEASCEPIYEDMEIEEIAN